MHDLVWLQARHVTEAKSPRHRHGARASCFEIKYEPARAGNGKMIDQFMLRGESPDRAMWLS